MPESGYKHSAARVPRLFKEAGKIVQKVKEEGGSFKGLVFQAKHPNLKSLYALVAETIRHSSELDSLLRRTQLLLKEPRLDPWVARVLITELLWRQRPLKGPAVPLKIVLSWKDELEAQLAAEPTPNTSAGSGLPWPRFVRINTLKISKQEIIYNLINNYAWQQMSPYEENHDDAYSNYKQNVSRMGYNQFMEDIHIPNLLVFPRSMKFYDMDEYHMGMLILQDKASCMSAHLLKATPGSTVLDMCAAPGMKTTHIAATINNEGTIYAIERHNGRYKSLCKVVENAGATCVQPINGDAMRFTHTELANVEYIVVDPSCSGSGMLNRKEIFNDEDDVSKQRLESLSTFQCSLLRHAMTSYPRAKRIVYSTCSLHAEENECVVEKVLSSCPPNFRPVLPDQNDQFLQRGSAAYGESGHYGFYAKPELDLTNGFFVIVFERTENAYMFADRPGMSRTSTVSHVAEERKKKTSKSTSKERNEEIKPSTLPALERMKRAMQNLNATQSSSQGSSAEPEKETSKLKKKKKKMEQVSEAVDGYVSPTQILEEESNLSSQKRIKNKMKSKDLRAECNSDLSNFESVHCEGNDLGLKRKRKKEKRSQSLVSVEETYIPKEKKNQNIEEALSEEGNGESFHLNDTHVTHSKKKKRSKKH